MHLRRQPLLICSVSLASLFAGGCVPAHKNALMFGTNTQVGVKVGVDERQIPTVIVGYNRQEAALVPLLTSSEGTYASANGLALYIEVAQEQLQESHKQAALAVAEPDPAKKSAAEKRADDLYKDALGYLTNGFATTPPAAGTDGALPPPIKILKTKSAKLSTYTLENAETLRRDCEVALRQLSGHSDKYMAKVKGDYREDAYSVLGTFSGSGTGKSKSGAGSEAELSGQIAQYFATGIAAQNLSLRASAVSSSPAAGEADAAGAKAAKAQADAVKAQADAAKAQTDIQQARLEQNAFETKLQVLVANIDAKGTDQAGKKAILDQYLAPDADHSYLKDAAGQNYQTGGELFGNLNLWFGEALRQKL